MKKILLALTLVASLSQACILDKIETRASETLKNNKKKTCFVAGIATAVIGKYAMPKVIDASKRVYNWIKNKIKG